MRILAVVLCLFACASEAAAAAQSLAVMRPWTLLIYGAVDNSADRPLIGFLQKIRLAIDDDPGIDMLLLIDRSESKGPKKAPFSNGTFLGEDFTGTRLYRVRKDAVERLPGGDQLPEITLDNNVELNSADPDNLGRFIAWGKKQSPARHYALLIYSHANGMVMCPDDTSQANMGIAEVSDKVSVENRVDFLALELCNMGGIEIAYQWRPGNGRFEADVMLAIPNAGPPLDWDRAFARIRTPGHTVEKGPAVDPTTMTSADFGRLVIEEAFLGRQAAVKTAENVQKIKAKFGGQQSVDDRDIPLRNESAGCYDLRFAGEVKKAVDALSVELARARAKEIVVKLCRTGADSPIRYDRDGWRVDLFDLARRISECNDLPDPARQAAKAVTDAIERFVIASFGMSNHQGFAAGKNGVYIVLPSGEANSWSQFAWYTPRPGAGRDFGRWSFLKDGATADNGAVENWFELLDLWFDTPDESGGENGYRP